MEQPDIPCVPADEAGKAVHRAMLAFLLDDRQSFVRLGYKVSKFKRRQIHQMADGFGFHHASMGRGVHGEHVVVWKRGTARPADEGGAEEQPGLEQQQQQQPQRQQQQQQQQQQQRPPTEDELKALFSAFLADPNQHSLNTPTWYSRETRKLIHELGDRMGFDHDSFGEKDVDRYIRVTKIDPTVLRQRQERQNGLNVAYQRYLNVMQEARERENTCIDRHVVQSYEAVGNHPAGGALRHMQFNIEWMSDWFAGSEARFVQENSGKEIDNVDELCRKVARVIKSCDPDSLSIEEGPENIAQMELFVSRYLDGNYHVFGGLENLQQQLYLLVRKNGPLLESQIHQASEEFLSAPWWFDVDGDRSLQDYKFTRRPLVVRSVNKNTGEEVFNVVLHLKSKYVAQGKRLWTSGRFEDVDAFVNKSIASRRRIAAECLRVRKCIRKHILEPHPAASVIVSGDLNAGPGMDFFEESYGIFDIIQPLLGSAFSGTEILFVTLNGACDDAAFSCEFDDFVDGVPHKKTLLDHVFVSHGLRERVLRSRVAHLEYQAELSNGGRKRQDRVSDHRPVVVDFAPKK